MGNFKADLIKPFIEEMTPEEQLSGYSCSLDCQGVMCEECELCKIVHKYEDCYKDTVSCKEVGEVFAEFVSYRYCHPTTTTSCRTCANYLAIGCREILDFYPEPSDYCSRYKPK